MKNYKVKLLVREKQSNNLQGMATIIEHNLVNRDKTNLLMILKQYYLTCSLYKLINFEISNKYFVYCKKNCAKIYS